MTTTEPTPGEYATMPVRITPSAVYFGAEKVPGCIAERGITLRAGGGQDCNRLPIEFLVGPVNAEDSYAEDITRPAETVTQFSSKAPR